MESKAWAEDFAGEFALPPPDPKKPRERKPHWIPWVLSREDVRELLGCSELTSLEQLMMRTLYASGARPEELAELKRDDLVAEGGGLRLGDRVALVDGETFKALASLKWERDWRWSLVSLKGLVRRAARGCRVGKRYEAMERKILPRALRVAFATHFLENGGGLFALHRLLGYPAIADTEHVFEVAIGLWRSVYDQTHPLAIGAGRGGSEGEHQHTLTLAEATAMIKACGEGPKQTHNWLILRLIYAAGLRVSEVCKFLVADLALGERRLFVRDSKERKDRYTLIDEGTAAALEQLVTGRAMDEQLFPKLKDSFVAAMIEKAGEDTGIAKKFEAQRWTLSPHTFRHSYATHVYEAGMEPATLKRLLGHQSVEETMGYVTCEGPEQREAYERARLLSL